MTKNPAIVIDNGTLNLKAGFADTFEHSVCFPTVIGEPKSSDIILGVDQKDFFVGNEIEGKMDLLNVSYPIQKGDIIQWNNMKKIWEFIFE